MDLLPYRERIDALDDEIVRLFARRMEIVEEKSREKAAEMGLTMEEYEAQAFTQTSSCHLNPEN